MQISRPKTSSQTSPTTPATQTASDANEPSALAWLRNAAGARRVRRAAHRRLLTELSAYRTPSERLELEAMLSRGAEREVEAINHLLYAGRPAA